MGVGALSIITHVHSPPAYQRKCKLYEHVPDLNRASSVVVETDRRVMSVARGHSGRGGQKSTGVVLPAAGYQPEYIEALKKKHEKAKKELASWERHLASIRFTKAAIQKDRQYISLSSIATRAEQTLREVLRAQEEYKAKTKSKEGDVRVGVQNPPLRGGASGSQRQTSRGTGARGPNSDPIGRARSRSPSESPSDGETESDGSTTGSDQEDDSSARVGSSGRADVPLDDADTVRTTTTIVTNHRPPDETMAAVPPAVVTEHDLDVQIQRVRDAIGQFEEKYQARGGALPIVPPKEGAAHARNMQLFEQLTKQKTDMQQEARMAHADLIGEPAMRARLAQGAVPPRNGAQSAAGRMQGPGPGRRVHESAWSQIAGANPDALPVRTQTGLKAMQTLYEVQRDLIGPRGEHGDDSTERDPRVDTQSEAVRAAGAPQDAGGAMSDQVPEAAVELEEQANLIGELERQATDLRRRVEEHERRHSNSRDPAADAALHAANLQKFNQTTQRLTSERRRMHAMQSNLIGRGAMAQRQRDNDTIHGGSRSAAARLQGTGSSPPAEDTAWSEMGRPSRDMLPRQTQAGMEDLEFRRDLMRRRATRVAGQRPPSSGVSRDEADDMQDGESTWEWKPPARDDEHSDSEEEHIREVVRHAPGADPTDRRDARSFKRNHRTGGSGAARLHDVARGPDAKRNRPMPRLAHTAAAARTAALQELAHRKGVDPTRTNDYLVEPGEFQGIERTTEKSFIRKIYQGITRISAAARGERWVSDEDLDMMTRKMVDTAMLEQVSRFVESVARVWAVRAEQDQLAQAITERVGKAYMQQQILIAAQSADERIQMERHSVSHKLHQTFWNHFRGDAQTDAMIALAGEFVTLSRKISNEAKKCQEAEAREQQSLAQSITTVQAPTHPLTDAARTSAQRALQQSASAMDADVSSAQSVSDGIQSLTHHATTAMSKLTAQFQMERAAKLEASMQLQAVTFQADTFKQNLLRYQQLHTDLLTTNQQLEANITELKTTGTNNAATIQTLQTEKASLDERIKTIQSNLEQTKKDMETKRTEAEAKLAELQTQLTTEKDATAEQRRLVQAANHEKTLIQKELERHRADLGSATTRVEALTTKVVDLESKTRVARIDAQIDADKDTAPAELEQTKQALARTREELTSAKQRVKELELSLENKETELTTKTEEARKATEGLQSKEKEFLTKTAEYVKLEKERTTLKKQTEQLSADIANKQEELESIRRRIENDASAKQRSEEREKETQNELVVAKKKMAELEASDHDSRKKARDANEQLAAVIRSLSIEGMGADTFKNVTDAVQTKNVSLAVRELANWAVSKNAQFVSNHAPGQKDGVDVMQYARYAVNYYIMINGEEGRIDASDPSTWPSAAVIQIALEGYRKQSSSAIACIRRIAVKARVLTDSHDHVAYEEMDAAIELKIEEIEKGNQWRDAQLRNTKEALDYFTPYAHVAYRAWLVAKGDVHMDAAIHQELVKGLTQCPDALTMQGQLIQFIGNGGVAQRCIANLCQGLGATGNLDGRGQIQFLQERVTHIATEATKGVRLGEYTLTLLQSLIGFHPRRPVVQGSVVSVEELPNGPTVSQNLSERAEAQLKDRVERLARDRVRELESERRGVDVRANAAAQPPDDPDKPMAGIAVGNAVASKGNGPPDPFSPPPWHATGGDRFMELVQKIRSVYAVKFEETVDSVFGLVQGKLCTVDAMVMSILGLPPGQASRARARQDGWLTKIDTGVPRCSAVFRGTPMSRGLENGSVIREPPGTYLRAPELIAAIEDIEEFRQDKSILEIPVVFLYETNDMVRKGRASKQVADEMNKCLKTFAGHGVFPCFSFVALPTSHQFAMAPSSTRRYTWPPPGNLCVFTAGTGPRWVDERISVKTFSAKGPKEGAVPKIVLIGGDDARIDVDDCTIRPIFGSDLTDSRRVQLGEVVLTHTAAWIEIVTGSFPLKKWNEVTIVCVWLVVYNIAVKLQQTEGLSAFETAKRVFQLIYQHRKAEQVAVDYNPSHVDDLAEVVKRNIDDVQRRIRSFDIGADL